MSAGSPTKNGEDKRKNLTRALTRMMSSVGTDYVTTRQAPKTNDEEVVDPSQLLKLYIRVGCYDRNVVRNCVSVALYGGRRWVSDQVEVWEDIDQRVYVRSLARALGQHTGQEGVLRRDDSGDRLNPDLSLQKNGIANGASLRFDITPQRRRTDSQPTRPKNGETTVPGLDSTSSRVSV